jgi:NAD(P)H-hydrate epimerase
MTTTDDLRPLSRAEVRALDARAADELGLPTLILMENAGRGAAERLAELAGSLPTRPRVVIVCGPGNNGGDGGVVARHLDAWGFPVRVVWFARRDQIKGDAETQRGIVERSEIPQEVWFEAHDQPPSSGDLDALFAAADWLVDGLFGTGLTRPLAGVFADVVAAMNRSGKPILALDLPSGLDADSGRPLGPAVRAAATVTFVARKQGFDAPEADAYTGAVFVVDIGLPSKLLRAFRG